MLFELSPLIVWTVFWIVNIYFEFQINIFSNNTDIVKSQFLHNNDNHNIKVIAIACVFSKNSWAKIKSWTGKL